MMMMMMCVCLLRGHCLFNENPFGLIHSFGWLFTKQKSSQAAYPQYTDLLAIVLLCVRFFHRSFNHMCATSPFAWVCHRWLHLNWIKLTIRKSPDSCCIIWGGIPSILILCSPRFQYRRYHCHFLCRVIYTSNIALAFFRFVFLSPPKITFTLFYLWRSRFFSLCNAVDVDVDAVAITICNFSQPFFYRTQLLRPQTEWLFPPCVRAICFFFSVISFFAFLIHSFNAPFKSAYFYASFTVLAGILFSLSSARAWI